MTETVVLTLNEAVGAFEKKHILVALGVHGGRRSETAKALGISRKSLWEKIRRHGIEFGRVAADDDKIGGSP